MASVENVVSIYMSLRGSLARAVLGIVPPKEVEDIVQETYVRVCQIEAKTKIREPRSFLFRTARNLALDHVKRAESRLAVSVEDSGELGFNEAERLTDATYDQVATNEEFSQFCEAVRQLPLQCRRAFVLRKVYGYSQREIAKDMSLSESTIEKHIAQGVKRCTKYMMENNKEPESGEPSNQAQKTQPMVTSPRGGHS